MALKTLPSVGIGLPVYNNARHLSKTLDSLLNQDYPNITIYVSDDCSDDGTDEICRRYAERDNRIKYFRNKINMGANSNHAKVLSLATTDYFMFARGHEVLSPNHIANCVRIMEEDETVVLACATTQWIDDDGIIMVDKPIGYFDTRGFDVATRCALVFWGNYECFYGLARTEVLRKTRALEEIMASGVIMLLEMALRGSFAHIRSSVRYRRYHYADETYGRRIERYKTSTYRYLKPIDRFFPFARLPYHLFLSVLKSHVSTGDKIKVLLVVLFNAPLRYLVSRGKQL
jgi:glycosyltransferase involved in cell wall biosynthesis